MWVLLKSTLLRSGWDGLNFSNTDKALLAANQGMDPAMMTLSMLEEVMTPAQIEEAKQLARKWKPKGQEEVL